MKLSANFTLEELTRSTTAVRLGIDNTPSGIETENLRQLAMDVLQPLRRIWRNPIVVSSGFRCVALNKAIGGSKSSQHLYGQAADIHTLSDERADNQALFATIVCLIREGVINVGQLIDEYDYNWIHISLPNGKYHNQVLHIR